MSLNLNPGFSHPVITPAERPVRNLPAHSVQVEVVVEAHVAERKAKRLEDYKANRLEGYMEALREVREEQPNTRHNLATRTYLQVAHYEGDFPLVDVYT